MKEIHVNFSDHDNCRLFNAYTFGKRAEQYINDGITDLLYNKESGEILAELMYNDFKVLPEYLFRYKINNIKTFPNISTLEK